MQPEGYKIMPQKPTVLGDVSDPRDPPRDPDCPLIWSFKTTEQVERWLAANKDDNDEPPQDD
jgi:hypothetical protein